MSRDLSCALKRRPIRPMLIDSYSTYNVPFVSRPTICRLYSRFEDESYKPDLNSGLYTEVDTVIDLHSDYSAPKDVPMSISP